MKKKIPMSKIRPNPVIVFCPLDGSCEKHTAAIRRPIPQPILPEMSKKRRPSLSEVKVEIRVNKKLVDMTIMLRILAVGSSDCLTKIV
jgi:hypothetical protein